MITPYLSFDGDCAAAMTFYAEVFGARDLQVVHYAEGPTAGATDRVMHARFSHAGGTLMARDIPDGAPHHAQQSVTLFSHEDDPDTAARRLERLAEGGTLLMAHARTGTSPGLGICRDRFGITWMVGVAEPATAHDLP